MTGRIFGLRCPTCGSLVDGYTKAFGDDKPDPAPGNTSLCVYCLAIGIYTDNLQLRRATPEELKEIMADKDFRKLYYALGQANLGARYRRRG